MYNIYIQFELVATGLSHGELCQWLLDLNDELSDTEAHTFRFDLGYYDESISFEDYLYDVFEPNNIVIARFGNERIMITEDDI